MNILFITDSDKTSGGIKQLYYNIVGLHQQGFNIYIACRENSDIVSMSAGCIKEVYHLKFEKRISESKLLAKKCKDWNINIIHTFHNKGHKIGVITKFFYNNCSLFINRGVTFPPGNLLFYHYTGINGYICNSYAVRNVLKKRLISDKKINVIYNAYVSDDEQFHKKSSTNIDRNNINICVIASGAKWKGLDLTIETFNKLNVNNIHLHSIGGVEKEDFYNIIHSDKKDKVTFWGKRTDVPHLLKQMDILIHLPRDGDSLPNVIIEAFDASLPVVCSDVGGISELVKNSFGGFVVNKGNTAAAANYLSLLISDKELRDKMGAYNHSIMESFSIDKKIKDLIQVYKGNNVKQTLDSI